MTKLLLILIALSLVFLSLNHPLSMALIMIIITTMICLCAGMQHLSIWYSFMLMMIMVGGMLVLVIYMTSIASNEMTESPLTLFISVISLTLLIMIPEQMIFNLETLSADMSSWLMKPSLMSLTKFFNTSNSAVIVIMINYLFITLIAIVKITNIKYGSLRQKF